MEHNSNLGLVTIRGLIIPAAWDNEGKVISVAVSTFDEDEYLVDKDEKGDQLLGLLRKEVEVLGKVGIRENFKTIKVNIHRLKPMA